MTKSVLFFATTNFLGLPQDSLFGQLQQTLPNRYRNLNFKFIDTTPEQPEEHPLLWSKAKRQRDPCSHLFTGWANASDIIKDELIPAWSDATVDVIIMKTFGLEIALQSTAYASE